MTITTSNLKGEVISKNSLIIHLLGTLDELNAHLGLVKVKMQNPNYKEFIEKTQHNLIKLMSHTSDTDNTQYLFTEKETRELINEIDKYKDSLPKQFVLPGKSETEAIIHIARTVARRAERCYIAACEAEEIQINQHIAEYLNRLSEYLFVLAVTILYN